MKLRHIVPVLGLAALLTVSCAQSLEASADRQTDLATETEASETKKECCATEAAVKVECTEAQKAECAAAGEKKDCPAGDTTADG